MATYKECREEWLADPAFRAVYDGYCPVCRTTVEVIGRMHKEGFSPEEAAVRAGVSIADVTDLEDAERCNPQAVRSLCMAFGIDLPSACPFETS
jgi:hypothetical protein